MKIVSTYFYNFEMLCNLNNCYMFMCVKWNISIIDKNKA
jgi:hypothetical protein